MAELEEERSAFDWEARFAEGTTPWERGQMHPAFLHWNESGAFDDIESIVVPGCGRAPEVAGFAEMGLKTHAADLSETAINWQRKHLDECNLTAELFTGDILDWTPSEPVDAVYEQTFLCAIHPRLRETYEAALLRWLRPGGQLFALFMQKEERGGPPYGCPPGVMHTLFPENRWIWPEGDLTPWPHPSLGGKAELGAILTRR